MTEERMRLSSMTDDGTTHVEAHADRLRGLEQDHIARRNAAADDGFDGVREFSRAWEENRSTAYLFQKSWSDPVSRNFAIIVILIIAAIWTYLLAF